MEPGALLHPPAPIRSPFLLSRGEGDGAWSWLWLAVVMSCRSEGRMAAGDEAALGLLVYCAFV
jgi:hypothetical protein